MKRLFAIILTLALLVGTLGGVGAAEPTDTLISEADYAAVDAMWAALKDVESSPSATRQSTAKTVAAAVVEQPLYVDGTLRWQGESSFTFETSVGVTCGYDPELLARTNPAETPSAALRSTTNYGTSGREVILIEPYYGLDESFSEQYQTEAIALAKALEGTYTVYTQNNATVDVVADAIERGSIVFFDSHGDTDYAKGEDYTTGATTSYLCLQTGTGLTTSDYAYDSVKGTYHAVNYGYGGDGMYLYAVDGTCIANHMDGNAGNCFLWMAICLGMATDGLEAPLRAKGVDVVYGYSQSVTFGGDYCWEETFWQEMRDGSTVAEAVAEMKDEYGAWDMTKAIYDANGWRYDNYVCNTISAAQKNRAAFPIVVSDQDVYPGHGKVDALQTVNCTWTLNGTETPEPTTEPTTVQPTPEPTEPSVEPTEPSVEPTEPVVEPTEPTPHTHHYIPTVTAPTCTEKGYTTYACSVCGDTYRSDFTDALGHTFGEWTQTTAPTCTEKGEDTRVCARCEAAETRESDALGHTWVVSAAVEPTCTTAGKSEGIHCSVCNAVQTTPHSIPALGHSYAQEITAPTCTEKGYTTYTCGICGDTYRADFTDAIGHTYTATVTAPTCTEKGHTTYVCACGDSYVADETDALGHDYADGECVLCGVKDPDYVAPTKPTEDPLKDFTDLPEGAWYEEGVSYALENGLMNGVGDNKFEPDETLTRAMLVTILYRAENTPDVTGLANPFTDVPAGEWYTDAVIWAADNGIVKGMTETTFEPMTAITREQMATILYRYAGSPEAAETDLSSFIDGANVQSYAVTAMQWAVAEGIIGGTEENGQIFLDPQGNATRAQTATILMRYLKI